MPDFGGQFFSSSVDVLPQRTTNPNFGQEYTEPAVVSVGPVDIAGPSKFQIQTAGTQYTDFVFKSKVCKDRRIHNLGVTSPGGFAGSSTVFVQLSAPTLLWVMRWTACRFGQIPEVPEPEPQSGSTWVLLKDSYEPGTVVLGTDGATGLYRISGTYLYGARNPQPATVLNLRFSVPPWLKPIDFTTIVSQGSTRRNMFGLES